VGKKKKKKSTTDCVIYFIATAKTEYRFKALAKAYQQYLKHCYGTEHIPILQVLYGATIYRC